MEEEAILGVEVSPSFGTAVAPPPVEPTRRKEDIPDDSRFFAALIKHYNEADNGGVAPAVVITVHLGTPLVLTQSRYGKTDRRRINKGDITITPPGEPKEWHHAGASEILCISVPLKRFEKIAVAAEDDLHCPVQIADCYGTRDPQIEHVGSLLLTELEYKGLGSHVFVDALGDALAVHLLRRYSAVGIQPLDTSNALPPYKLNRAIQYINEHLAEHLTLCQIANAVHMSPCHFARGFKQSTGQSPHQYIIECRIERAKVLLRETDLPITEIAYQTGCTTQSHFSVLFRRMTSMTPRIYRQRYRSIRT